MAKDITTIEDVQQTRMMNWFLFIGILLVGANLRVPLTSVGSLIPIIRDDLAINNALAGFITTIPLIAFALISPIVPKIANRISMERAILYSMLLLTIGFLIRSYIGVFGIFFGTVLIGIAISFGNVLLPGFIKLNFPIQVGLVTGMYSVIMNLFGALGSGLSVPLASIGKMNWNGSLAFWGILSLIALVCWGLQLKKNNNKEMQVKTSEEKGTMWKSPLAWSITIFMGLQSLVFYTLITWLPDLLLRHEFSSSEAGWMLFLLQISLFPSTFLVPIIAERMKNQKLLSAAGAVLFFLGVLGLLIGQGFILILSTVFIGLASGTTFSLSMMFFSLRTTSGQQAAEISGMAQSIGYLLAATGPVLFGAFYDITNSWILPMGMLMLCAVIMFVVGIQSGSARVIESEK